ncbi:hypothetical protein BHM03_00022959, partial [Ensete ventricosum]
FFITGVDCGSGSAPARAHLRPPDRHDPSRILGPWATSPTSDEAFFFTFYCYVSRYHADPQFARFYYTIPNPMRSSLSAYQDPDFPFLV